MSIRVDTASLISGAVVVGNRGLGVLGSDIPSTGTNGASYLYADLSLPADANKEYSGFVVTPPGVGNFFAYEDGSYTYFGQSTTFVYKLREDGVDKGNQTITITSPDGAAPGATLTGASTISAGAASSGAATSATAPGASLTGASTIAAGAASGTAAATAAGATLTGTSTIAAGAATGASAGSAPGASLTGTSTITAGAATGSGSVAATAPGATLTGTSSIYGGYATNGTAPYVSPSRTVVFEGCVTTVRF